jgi:hypothetical protein
MAKTDIGPVLTLVALLVAAWWLTREKDTFDTIDKGCSPTHPTKGSRADTRGMCCPNKWSNRSSCVLP